jgi:hypothetical protein
VWFIADGVNTALFSALLASFAAEVGAGVDKHVILVLDGAGWHVAKDLEVPEGVELMFLPPYSPQIQPAERLWPLTNEGSRQELCVAVRHKRTNRQRDVGIPDLPWDPITSSQWESLDRQRRQSAALSRSAVAC